MKKNVFLICFLLFFVACNFEDCNPNGPDDPSKIQDIVEFMYQRTLPIVDNDATGPKGFSIWNTGGGRTIKRLTYLGNDQWVGAKALPYNKRDPYWICTIDMKVTGAYEAVAETFYARIQGTSEWTELTCIGPDPNGTGGLAAKFYLDDKGIRIP